MAGIGLSKPFYAKYTNTDGVVTYSNGGLMGKAVEVDISIDSASDDNALYADNGIDEVDKASFAGGTMTLTTNDLLQDVTAVLMGITASTVTVGEDTVTELVYDDDMAPPELGVGMIFKHRVGGADKWRSLVLLRVKFSVPQNAATTQGETIEWNTPQIEGTIMRSAASKNPWMREAWVDTEAGAEAYIKQILNIPNGGGGG